MRTFRKLRTFIGRFRREESGTILIVSALFLPVALAATALAVDVGSLYVERRAAQGATDLAAMAGAADLTRAKEAVVATLAANRITDAKPLAVIKGRYTPDPTLAAAARFQAGVEPYNAVRVSVTRPGRLFFAKVFRSTPIDLTVNSFAASSALATFSIGSRLLAIRDGLLNELLGSLTGSNVNLSVMDYNSLISADIKLGGFLDALATQLNLKAATYDDVLNAKMTMGDVLAAAAATSSQDGNKALTTALETFGKQSGSASLTTGLSSIINLGPLGSAAVGKGTSGLDAAVNVMDLLTGAAGLANGTNQAALDLGANVPGLLSLKATLTIGEREKQSPWVAVGQEGATIYTAQMRLRITAEIGGTGLLANARINLPIGIDAAFAKATLTSITCGAKDRRASQVEIAARPGVFRAWIGDTSQVSMANFASQPSPTTATLVDLPLIKVTGKSDVAVTNTSDTTLRFTQSDVENKTIKRVETTNYTETLVTTLLSKLNLQVQIAGIGLGTSTAVNQLVVNAIKAVAPTLDNTIAGLINRLGVHLGEADVRVHGIQCGGAVLFG